MDIANRIFMILNERGMEQKWFANAIGVIPQTVTDWKSGKSKSYTKYLPQIAEVLGTTTEYLLTGEGPKHKGKDRFYTPKEIVEFMSLLEQFKQLSADAQKEVAAFIAFKLSQEGKSQQSFYDLASVSSSFLFRAREYLKNYDGQDAECYGIEQVPIEKGE